MVSQPQGYVHLLATAPAGEHEPQVFRMRWDQPLKRFARAYAVFRELCPELEAALKMSTVSHGDLDPNSTAGVYGLGDGDHVIFTTASPETGVEAEADPQARAAEVALRSTAAGGAAASSSSSQQVSPNKG